MFTNNFNRFLEKELNKPQREAVIQQDGALLVVAGAGSGKTRVITARMSNLILNQGVDPTSILALTFTNKAANEMKKRLTSFLGTNSRLPFVGTFHAYCLLLLRTNPNILPFTDFSIIDDDDQKSLLKKILKKNNLEKQISVTQIKHQISKAKNQLERNEELYKNPFFKEVYLAYESEKAAAHCFDFDDLLLTVLKIFQTNKEFKARFQSRVRHILVDEYQDTNGVQHELLKEMGLHKKKFILDSLCAVGDEDQSIYSWRGAKVTNMLSFQNDFAPVTLVKIEQNYRSVQPILKAANSVIEHNTQRHPKKLWSDKKGTNRILTITCQSGYHEAGTIAEYIKVLPSKTKRSNVAILYRTHFQSRSIEESLIRASIPYVIIGGIRFYERKEIKDLMAYLRLIANPFDKTSLFRIINTPARGLGAKFEELLYNEWHNNPLLDFKQMLQLLLDTPEHKVKGVKAIAVKKFLKIFKGLERTGKPTEVLSQIIEQSEYLSYLRRAYDEHEADTKIENIQEFAQSIETFEKHASTGASALYGSNTSQVSEKETAPTLENFLHEIALLQEKLEGNDQATDHIQMMTLHAAKGLEFDTVLIAGLEEGLLPSSRSLHSNEAIEEERRLFYVGMTRAMERLIILRAQYRNTYGQVTDQLVSPFLTEVPSRLIQHLDLAEVHPAKTKTLLAQWLGSKLPQTVQTFGPKARKPVSTRQKFGASRKTKTTSKKNTRFQPSFAKAKQKKPVKPVVTSRKLATKKTASKSSAPAAPWKRNQLVLHKKFGPGLVKKVEAATSGNTTNATYYLTIKFKDSERRILSSFVRGL